VLDEAVASDHVLTVVATVVVFVLSV